MDMIKKFGPPAVLAVVGVRASEAIGVSNKWARLGLAVGGAFAGLVIASKV